MGEWRPDVLGEGFEALELALNDEAEPAGQEGDPPPLTATLVRSLPAPEEEQQVSHAFWRRFLRTRAQRDASAQKQSWHGAARAFDAVDVLYVHGWSDYFFQRELAQFFTSRGARFFALDLRRHGRSLREGQLPGYVEQLSDYDEEIDLALAEMGHGSRAEAGAGARKLVVLGHSTGGLVLSLWAQRHPGVADAIVLNSPWLVLQMNEKLTRALAPVVSLRAHFSPHDLALPQLDLGFYSRAQREIEGVDELVGVNPAWRPERAFPVRAGWLNAIIAAQAEIHGGIDVGAPVCVLLADRTHFGLVWREEMLSSDTVIEVNSVAKAALNLGSSVTVERVAGGLHDVFLSGPKARADAYARVERWLTGWIAGQPASYPAPGPASLPARET